MYIIAKKLVVLTHSKPINRWSRELQNVTNADETVRLNLLDVVSETLNGRRIRRTVHEHPDIAPVDDHDKSLPVAVGDAGQVKEDPAVVGVVQGDAWRGDGHGKLHHQSHLVEESEKTLRSVAGVQLRRSELHGNSKRIGRESGPVASRRKSLGPGPRDHRAGQGEREGRLANVIRCLGDIPRQVSQVQVA